MSEIPEDVMKAARDALWVEEREMTAHVESVARALMAERDRAVIDATAKKYTYDQGMDHEMEMFNDGVDAAIVAIRNGPAS